MATKKEDTKVKPKATPTKTKQEKVKIDNKVDEEREKLKAKNDEMAEMLSLMKEQMKAMQSQIAQQNQTMPTVVLEQNKDITRTVKVTSLIGNLITLSTMRNGNKSGQTYRFEAYGQTRPILFSHLQQILNHHSKQFEDGKVVLSSEQDYNDLGIGYIYNSVALKEKIDELVKLKDDSSVDAILSMNENMIEKITDMIAKNMANGVSYDFNKIKALKEEGYDIEELSDIIKSSNGVNKDTEKE